MIDRSAIEAAHARIGDRVRVTPVFSPGRGAFGIDAAVELELECLQHTGSFKPRGAFNRMLAQPLPAAGVIAASGGNHGAAVAYAARALGVPAEVFVPTIASAAKIEHIRACGAELTIAGESYAESLERLRERAAAAAR